jgi:hypothetical protein
MNPIDYHIRLEIIEGIGKEVMLPDEENQQLMQQNTENLKRYIEDHHDAIQEIAKEVVARRIMLKINAGLWLSVNLLLLLIYSLTNVTLFTLLWSVVPWGLFVIIHLFNYKVFRNGLFSNYNEYAYAYTIFLFFIINILLIFIDVIDATPISIEWYWWALMGLTIALALHTIIFFILQQRIKKRQALASSI